jgi:CRISPR-associated protein Cpf1
MSRRKKIDRLINQYSVSKTLRFSLIPEGRTEEHFECRCLLEEDQQRAKDYGVIKEYIDRYHKSYIEQRLATLLLDDVQSYAGLYCKGNKTDKERDEMEKLEQSMRKKVAKALTDGSEYKRLFQKDLIEELLPAFLQNADEKAVVERFRGFTTYFMGFHENRKNMYTHEAKATAVGYRCINQNLPRFLDNVASFRRICAVLPEADLQQLNGEISGLCGTQATDAFSAGNNTAVSGMQTAFSAHRRRSACGGTCPSPWG